MNSEQRVKMVQGAFSMFKFSTVVHRTTVQYKRFKLREELAATPWLPWPEEWDGK